MTNKSIVISVLSFGLALFAALIWFETRPPSDAQLNSIQPERLAATPEKQQ